jgi:hypothetical protein
LVGSANLTAKATGKANLPNIELLIETAADRGEVTALLAQLMADSIPATPTVAAEIRARADLLVENGLVSPAIGPERDEMTRWYPTTRAPERLYRVYLGDPRGCPHAILEGVLSDLAHLDLAPGLDRQQFGIAVLERIYTFPEVAELVSSGRTSSVDLEAALLATGGTSTDAAERALILTRWLICFDALLHTVPSGPYDIVRGRQLE